MENFQILFVDDEREILSAFEKYLSHQGYRVNVVDNGFKALELLKKNNFDIVFTDLQMPGLSGIELLMAIKEYRPETEVIIITGYGTIESAVEALKLGSYDYIQKPIKMDHLKLLIDRIIDKRLLENENLLLKKRIKERYSFKELVGINPRMQQIFEIIDRISLKSPTVLIQGESGTGKEIVANVIHQNSNRKNKPFIPVNCAAIVDGLLESELFGHVKGSFTGAIRDKMGLFQAAEGGTIFLDEIADVPRSLQVKLLRFLQDKRIRPVGSIKELKIDVRIIAATNRDPEEAIRNGDLRNDLFYRLNVVSINIPSLKERKEDIAILINHFLNKFNSRSQRKLMNISPEALDILEDYHWPGNVRQLENVIERAFALGVNKTITVNDLPSEIRKLGQNSGKDETSHSLRKNEIMLIKRALRNTKSKKNEAARLLEIDLSTLYRKIKKYNIDDKKYYHTE
ncbi:MAG: sigma-54 dependent transcriptional regulator [Thermodesulfobacteriota bacterium]|nr:sigma-54 dependent transcriptional regulator [Thermodesulfobacteriota bacterium]